MAIPDTSVMTDDELLKRPFDTAAFPLPLTTGVSPGDYPLSDLTLNREWFAYIAGVLDRLAYADAWETEDPEEAADYVQHILAIQDAIGQFTPTRSDFCNEWLSGNANPTTTWSIVMYGSYYAPTNLYFGTSTTGLKTIQIEAVINKPITHIGLTLNSFTDNLTMPRGYIRFFNDGVKIFEAQQVNGSAVNYEYSFGGTTENPHPNYIGTLRIIAWIIDDTPADPNNFIFLIDLLVEGWGEPIDLISLCP